MREEVVAGALMWCIAVTTVGAQVLDRPTPRPTRTAANESWFVDREPIFVAGDYYYPAGASVFFDPETMVLTGFYGNVPLYWDTTLEPHSLVFVPVGRGLMQPYERRRAGDIVGTSGSRPPSFPVQKDAEAMLGQISEYETATGVSSFTPGRTIHQPDAAVPTPLPGHGVLRTAREPRATDGVWVLFRNVRWFSAGPAVVFDPTAFERVGEYQTFPVFRARVGRGDVIYIPSSEGLVAPYGRR
jgi:hypothetical protein